VNNAENGVHVPSIPRTFRKGGECYAAGKRWSGLAPEKQEEIAFVVMRKMKKQFHVGNHHIDDDEPEVHDEMELIHNLYDEFLKGLLLTLSNRVQIWANHCENYDKKHKRDSGCYQPSVRINRVLDNLSAYMKNEISGKPPERWRIFLSELAKSYHHSCALHHNLEAAQRTKNNLTLTP
jgi:hypothetical protein